jgi:hypothetical protein
MYKVKIILISILSISFIGLANAQHSEQANQQTSLDEPQKKTTVITYEVKPTSEKVKEELNAKNGLKTEIADKTVEIIADSTVSVSIDTAKVVLADIEKRLAAKGYVLLIPEPAKETEVEVEPPTLAEKYNPEIDKFLNREDEFVFKDETFMGLQDSQIHPRSRNYYQLIKEIHLLDSCLRNVERTLTNSNVEKIAKELNLLEETVKSMLLEQEKKNIDIADGQFVKIIPFAKELTFLSSQQQQYYKLLKDKFNDWYSIIYHNNQLINE